jgi:hypothetical protein
MRQEENLNALRVVIHAEMRVRTGSTEGFTIDEIARALLTNHRTLVIKALHNIVDQAVDAFNDNLRVQRILEADQTGMKAHVPFFESVAEAMGIGTSDVMTMDPDSAKKCADAMMFIADVQVAVATAETERQEEFMQRIGPIVDGHPEMRVGEAVAELERRTAKTIKELEGDA